MRPVDVEDEPESCAFSLSQRDVDPAIEYDGYDCPRARWRGHTECILHKAHPQKPTDELIDTIEAGGPLDGAKLSHVSLPDDYRLNLEGRSCVGLEGRNLRALSISGRDAKFQGADLTGSRLNYSNFQGASFKGATLDDAYLISANLSDAVLTNVNAHRAKLPGADLRHAILVNIHLQGSNLVGANLEDVETGGAILDGADLEHANLRRCRLHGTDFRRTRIYNCTFDGSSVSENTKFTVPYEDEGEWGKARNAYRILERLMVDNGFEEQRWEVFRAGQKVEVRRARAEGNLLRFGLLKLWEGVAGFGTSPGRVGIASLLVLLTAALLYPWPGLRLDEGLLVSYEVGGGLGALIRGLWLSLYFSIATFTSLGFGDVLPDGVGAEILAGFEALAGAVLTGIFIFTLGRRAS